MLYKLRYMCQFFYSFRPPSVPPFSSSMEFFQYVELQREIMYLYPKLHKGKVVTVLN